MGAGPCRDGESPRVRRLRETPWESRGCGHHTRPGTRRGRGGHIGRHLPVRGTDLHPYHGGTPVAQFGPLPMLGPGTASRGGGPAELADGHWRWAFSNQNAYGRCTTSIPSAIPLAWARGVVTERMRLPICADLASIHVRREALTIRVEVRDLPPLTLSQQGGEAGGSLTREAPVRVGAAPTKPGRVSTARWCGSGEHGEEEYARNQRYYVS